jgi:hypothetical protein
LRINLDNNLFGEKVKESLEKVDPEGGQAGIFGRVRGSKQPTAIGGAAQEIIYPLS